MTKEESTKLKRLFEIYEQPMYRIAFAVLKDSAAAEDAVSDAFMRIIPKIGKIGEPDSPKTKSYIIKTLKNTAIDIYRRKIRFNSYFMDAEEEFDKIPDTSENYETYESGDKKAMINYRAPNIYDMTIHHDNSDHPGYSRNIFVTFGETSYLVEINISDDVSDEDLRKIIDNMELIPTEEKMYGDYIPFLDPDNSSSSNYEETLQDAVNMNVVHVGDTVYYDNEEYFGGFSFTLNSAEFIDNFDGINTDACGNYADYSQYMDENGNIIENIRSIIEFGDGVNSNDKVLSEESIPMHILKIKATFTNTRDVENEIGIDPTMFAIQDGKPVNQAFVNYNGQRYIDSVSGVSGSMDFFSMDTAPEKKGSKNAVLLAPGESAEVQLAFWVPDDLKDEVYFMQRLGNGYDTEINKGSPVFDLRSSTIG